MRRAPLAVVLLLVPGVLACFAGGYSDQPRLVAGIAVWALLGAAVLLGAPPLPRSRPAWLALGGLARLGAGVRRGAPPRPRSGRGWRARGGRAGRAAGVALSTPGARVAEPAGKDAQRLLVYVGALAAGLALLRGPAARLTEPLLLLSI